MEMLLLVILCSWLYKTIFKPKSKEIPVDAFDVLHGGDGA